MPSYPRVARWEPGSGVLSSSIGTDAGAADAVVFYTREGFISTARDMEGAGSWEDSSTASLYMPNEWLTANGLAVNAASQIAAISAGDDLDIRAAGAGAAYASIRTVVTTVGASEEDGINFNVGNSGGAVRDDPRVDFFPDVASFGAWGPTVSVVAYLNGAAFPALTPSQVGAFEFWCELESAGSDLSVTTIDVSTGLGGPRRLQLIADHDDRFGLDGVIVFGGLRWQLSGTQQNDRQIFLDCERAV